MPPGETLTQRPRFIEQRGRMTALEYHAAIVEQGLIHTRSDSIHDLMNALVWLSFPEAKSALHRAHYEAAQTRSQTAPSRRTAAENMLSHFDESGTVVISENE